MYYTYIVFSESLDKYYTGQTEDVARRLLEHNTGKAQYMKTGVPWVLVFAESFGSRSEAMALEQKIKKRGAKRYLIDHNLL